MERKRMRPRTERHRVEDHWQAVQKRDCAADGAFVYAVRSTGIYCRPSCPSRRPGREQVVFFPLPEAAEQKGFRACQRCRPRSTRLGDPRSEAVAAVCRQIDTQIRNEGDDDSKSRLTLTALSTGVGMGPHQLKRPSRREMGNTPRKHADP